MSIWYQRFRLSDKPNKRILTEKVRKRAWIGRAHWGARLQRIPESAPYKQEIKDYIANMPELESRGKGLVLHGPLGTGKTSIGTIVLRNGLARGARVLSLRMSDMIDYLMSNSRTFLPNGAPLQEALRHVNFLLLDDFVMEDKDWRMRQVESVMRRRYDDCLPTIITTNMSKDELFGVPWLLSLFSDKEHYAGIEISGINWRGKPPKE